MDILFLLSLLLIIVIIMISCPVEKFEQIKTSTDDNESKQDSKLESKQDSHNELKQPNKTKKEEYYDYKYTYNAAPPVDTIRNVTKEIINEKDERPININISYPPPPGQLPSNERIVYYDTTLLQNLSGNPVDQVQTDYSVIEDDTMYKSWDKYYLPGYSYFPPSKWQLPRDNSLVVPKELRDEKCDVCPLVASNGSGNNYLSGDILQGNTVTAIPQNKELVTKYATINKGMNGLKGNGTTIAEQKYEKTD